MKRVVKDHTAPGVLYSYKLYPEVPPTHISRYCKDLFQTWPIYYRLQETRYDQTPA